MLPNNLERVSIKDFIESNMKRLEVVSKGNRNLKGKTRFFWTISKEKLTEELLKGKGSLKTHVEVMIVFNLHGNKTAS